MYREYTQKQTYLQKSPASHYIRVERERENPRRSPYHDDDPQQPTPTGVTRDMFTAATVSAPTYILTIGTHWSNDRESSNGWWGLRSNYDSFSY